MSANSFVNSRFYQKMMAIRHNKVFDWIFSIVIVAICAAFYALAVKVFVSPKRLLAGGVSGISLLLGRFIEATGWLSFSETNIAGVLTLVFNIPLLILAWKKLNLKFAILSSVHVITVSTLVAFLPNNMSEIIFKDAWNDIGILDAALFAGAIVGISTGFCFHLGGSSGGMDIVAYYFSSRKQVTVGKLNSIINASIIILSIILFPSDGVDKALYTLIYIFTNSFTLDLVFNRNKKNMIHIVTNNGEAVSKFIMANFYRGVTQMDAKGAYTGNHKDFLYVIATAFESLEIAKEVKKFDPDCFITIVPVGKVYGRFVNKDIHN